MGHAAFDVSRFHDADLAVGDAVDPVHGQQEGRFFHAYYGDYCYLPLYIIAATGRCWRGCAPARDAARGAVDKVAKIVAALRAEISAGEDHCGGDSAGPRAALLELAAAATEWGPVEMRKRFPGG